MPNNSRQVSPRAAPQTTSGAADFVRKLLVVVFVLLASLAFATFTAVRWTEKQILNTDGWVSFSSRLPQNTEVSSALARTLTGKIYANVPLEQRVAEALPPRAGFLAGPISDQLRTRTTNIVQKFVQSDTFQSVWTGANRLAMDRFLTNARSGKEPGIQMGNEKITVDLAAAQPQLRERLSDQTNLSPALQEKGQNAFALTADLQAKRAQLWHMVRTVDALYAVLPMVFVASFLGAIALARIRSKTVISISVITILLLLLELVLVRLGHQRVINHVSDSANVTAISYVYDSLVGPLRTGILYAILGWLAIIILALLASNMAWAMRARSALSVPNLSHSRLARAWWRLRIFSAKYRYAIWGLIVIGVLVYLAFAATVNTAALINTILVALAAFFVVYILSRPFTDHALVDADA